MEVCECRRCRGVDVPTCRHAKCITSSRGATHPLTNPQHKKNSPRGATHPLTNTQHKKNSPRGATHPLTNPQHKKNSPRGATQRPIPKLQILFIDIGTRPGRREGGKRDEIQEVSMLRRVEVSNAAVLAAKRPCICLTTHYSLLITHYPLPDTCYLIPAT